MITKGIRGAITVDSNTQSSIKEATIELLNSMIERNGIEERFISHILFTVTDDLSADFPAKFARLAFEWDHLAMICLNELAVPDSLRMCLRVLLVLNCEEDFSPKHVYLKGAKVLRPDLG